MKPKDMMLIPQRLALALQADGWWVRSDIIWAKPNPMPESVTDRPTKSHEYIWLLAKSKDYFWDQEGVKEDSTYPDDNRKARSKDGQKRIPSGGINGVAPGSATYPTRNLRDVWGFPTQNYSGAHYATYPEELVLRCLKAATSERGCCPKCGKQWEREVERDDKRHWTERNEYTNSKYQLGNNISGRDDGRADFAKPEFRTLGFLPGCACDLPPVPATILDPFAGSGTTLLVAKRMGLNAVGLDLSYQYLRENAWERVGMGQPVMV
jgi:DNA modification methylase